MILMDIQMSVMDGLEASKYILNIDPNAIIIACTANDRTLQKRLNPLQNAKENCFP